MLVRLRIGVPDRPGSLGRVAAALGAAGADIERVEVLESEAGHALDDVFVRVRDGAHAERARAALSAVPGVEVAAAQYPAPPATGHAELELVAQVVAHPREALQTLVNGVPLAVGADWAVLLEFGAASGPWPVLEASAGCPGTDAVAMTMPLRLAAPTVTPRGITVPYGGAAVVPVGAVADGGSGMGLVVVREAGPGFHRAELWRLEQIGRIAGSVAGRAVAVPG